MGASEVTIDGRQMLAKHVVMHNITVGLYLFLDIYSLVNGEVGKERYSTGCFRVYVHLNDRIPRIKAIEHQRRPPRLET
jgi:hypothetical protein